MNLTIDLNGVDPVIAEVKKIAAPESLAKANERMGEGVKSWLSSWYRNKAESGHFENTSLPTHGPGRKKTGWANDIARNWFADTTADGARIYLTGQAGEGNGGEPLDLAQSLLLKIYGGTVTAKRAQALTIPVIASGGLGSMADIEKLCAVEDEGIEGVICGRAIYSGDLDFAKAQERADELNG